MNGNPHVSFLTAVDSHPRPADLTLGALIRQTLPPADYECVIIGYEPRQDYLSSMRRAMQEKSPSLRLHFETVEKPGRAYALNHGLALCRAPLILFFGDDFVANPKTAQAHLDFHRQAPDHRRVGVGSALLAAGYRTHFSDWLERSGSLYGVPFHADMTSVPTNYFYVGNSSVQRAFLQEAGPFDEDYEHHTGDDYELGLRLSRLGMTSVYVPGAMAQHMHAISLAERCRAMLVAGRDAAMLARKGGQPQSLYVNRFEPAWRYGVRAATSRLKSAVTRRDDDLISYYKAQLDGAFVAGYRQMNGSTTHQPDKIA